MVTQRHVELAHGHDVVRRKRIPLRALRDLLTREVLAIVALAVAAFAAVTVAARAHFGAGLYSAMILILAQHVQVWFLAVREYRSRNEGRSVSEQRRSAAEWLGLLAVVTGLAVLVLRALNPDTGSSPLQNFVFLEAFLLLVLIIPFVFLDLVDALIIRTL